MSPSTRNHDPPLAVWPYKRATKTSKALRRPSKPAGCFCVVTLFLRAPLYRPQGCVRFWAAGVHGFANGRLSNGLDMGHLPR
jgi:hypothetical protein